MSTAVQNQYLFLKITHRKLENKANDVTVHFTHIFAGSITGAVIFGRLLDNACLLWNEECGIRGRCLHYDRFQMALSTVLYGFAMKTVAIVCFIGTLATYKPQRKVEKGSKMTLQNSDHHL